MSSIEENSLITSQISLSINAAKQHDFFYNHINIWIVRSGEFIITHNDKDLFLTENDFIILNPNHKYHIKLVSDIHVFEIHLDHPAITNIFKSKNQFINCCSVNNDNDAKYQYMKHQILDLMQSSLKKSQYNALNEISIFFKLSHYILDNFTHKNRELNNKNQSISTKHANRIDDIISYIDDNFREKISLQDLADKKYLSLSYLSKFFKEKVGTTFSEYVQKKRLSHAERELVQTNTPIIRIALNSGFPNATIFNQVFKKHFGITPLAYRKHKNGLSQNTENILDKSIKVDSILPWLPEWNTSSHFHDKLISLSESKNVDIDLALEAGRKYFKPWNKIINVGHAKDLLDPEMRSHLTLIQKDLKFTYARFWGIFNDTILLESPDVDDGSYNFDNIDKIVDFFFDLQLYPFIELGPKPKVIHKSKHEDVSFSNFTSKNRSYDEIQHLLQIYLAHATSRYGINYVKKWAFELWQRDADSSGRKYWTTGVRAIEDRLSTNNINEYIDLFCRLHKIIKSFSEEISFGGWGLSPDTNQSDLELMSLEFSKRDVSLDFLSVYIFSVELMMDNVYRNPISITEHEIILAFIKRVRSTELKNLPIFVTEWNSTISNRSLINDMACKAAYIANTALRSIGNLDALGYWMASDLFSNSYDTNKILNGQAGLLSKNGIKKPTYHSLRFLSKLGPFLIMKGENYGLFSDEQKNLQLIVINYKKISNYDNFPLLPSSSDKKSKIVFNDVNSSYLTLSISGVPDGNYRIKHYKIDEESGSIFDEWKKFDNTGDVLRDEVEYLKNRSTPKMLILNKNVDSGVLNLESLISPHGVELFIITKK